MTVKQKILVINWKKILHKLFFFDRLKVVSKEKENIIVCPCQELKYLTGEMRLISEQLKKLNPVSYPTQDFKVENINVEKIVLESLSFELGNIDVDAIHGTMNIGITVNLQSGALKLPEKIKLTDDTTYNSDPTLSFGKQTNKKKVAYHICINPNSSEQEKSPKITRRG